MEQSQIILWCIKLVLGGIAAFFAILLWSKSRKGSWMCLVASVIFSYANIIYQMMFELGVITQEKILLFNVPVITLCFTVIPSFMLIIALILIIKDLS